jgi:hypothetical protein
MIQVGVYRSVERPCATENIWKVHLLEVHFPLEIMHVERIQCHHCMARP